MINALHTVFKVTCLIFNLLDDQRERLWQLYGPQICAGQQVSSPRLIHFVSLHVVQNAASITWCLYHQMASGAGCEF